MVVFTCGNCGESIKKPSVAKHYMSKCRGPVNVSCVDCFKDFRGNEYEAHIKCITEEERYAAKGFVAKASSNKGEKKQQTWFEAVQNILDSDRNLKNDERELLQVLSAHENLPRKKGKFINFLGNAHRAYARRQDLVERVWGIIEVAGKAATASLTNGTKDNEKTEQVAVGDDKANKDEKENGIAGEISERKKSKRKLDTKPEVPEKKGKLDVKDNPVLTIIKQSDGSINLHKLLQSLKQHCESVADAEKAAKMLKKMEKRILIISKDDRVELNVELLNR